MQRRHLLAAAAAPLTAIAASACAAGGSPASRFAPGKGQTTHYLESGARDAPTIVLVHGWPETSLSWRHVMPVLAQRGYRVIAPDLRGCGESTVHMSHADYAQARIVADMLALADHAGIERALWVGHDWGAPVVWNLASHHPRRCHGVAALAVPYDTLERGLPRLRTLVDRQLYPEASYPFGQYDYIAFYQEHFAQAQAVFDANPEDFLKVVMRRGDPQGAGKVFPLANVRRQGGWFGPGQPPPKVPLDTAVLDDATLQGYAAAYRRTTFFGINSLYMNDAVNAAYADEARAGGVLELPALFLGGRFDWVNDPVGTALAEPMRSKCRNLQEVTIDCGHWMQNEAPGAVTQALLSWISSRLPAISTPHQHPDGSRTAANVVPP